MFSVGDKIIYGENGVCTVSKVGPLEMSGASSDKLFYHLEPLVGSGTYYTPVDSGAFMRPCISRAMASWISCSVWVSMLAVASSRIRMAGS